MGLWLYDKLAGNDNIAPHRWYCASDLRRLAPSLKSQGLQGKVVLFFMMGKWMITNWGFGWLIRQKRWG